MRAIADKTLTISRDFFFRFDLLTDDLVDGALDLRLSDFMMPPSEKAH